MTHDDAVHICTLLSVIAGTIIGIPLGKLLFLFMHRND